MFDMKTEEFDYKFDPDLIAQEPAEQRDKSRMMVLDRSLDPVAHDCFYNLPRYLECGDVLVLNDSKVVPALLSGRKGAGAAAGAKIEMLLLSKKGPLVWEVLLKPAKRAAPGTAVWFDDGSRAEIISRVTDKKWLVEFQVGDFDSFLRRCGLAPLPPYIRRGGRRSAPRDIERYQTVYAAKPGSIAAPTAGLHFTEKTIRDLRGRGVSVTAVTLHVGLGTFIPIEEEIVEDHRMEEENYEISAEAAGEINAAKRIVAVGTTSARVLESAVDGAGRVRAGSGATDLFIYPGYRFRKTDALLTNFHLPKSSLFLLACAFTGTERIKAAYREAIERRYRFYSYGDCMLIL